MIRPERDCIPTPTTVALRAATTVTFAAVVMVLSGAPRPSQIKWCLLPAFRWPTGDGPVSAPPSFRTDVGTMHVCT